MVQPLVADLSSAGTNGSQPGRAGGRTFSRGSYNGSRLIILCRGRNLGTFCTVAENSFWLGFTNSLPGQKFGHFLCRGREFILFYLFISFLHFKIVFVYFDATTYRTRSSIQIYTTLVVTWRSQLPGLSPSIRLHGPGSSVAPIIHTKFSSVVYHLFQQKSRQFLCNFYYALLR